MFSHFIGGSLLGSRENGTKKVKHNWYEKSTKTALSKNAKHFSESPISDKAEVKEEAKAKETPAKEETPAEVKEEIVKEEKVKEATA